MIHDNQKINSVLTHATGFIFDIKANPINLIISQKRITKFNKKALKIMTTNLHYKAI